MDNQEENKVWTMDLKKGDKVLLYHSSSFSFGSGHYSEREIDHVTATGIVVIKYGQNKEYTRKYYPNGQEIGNRYHKETMKNPKDQDIIDDIKRITDKRERRDVVNEIENLIKNKYITSNLSMDDLNNFLSKLREKSSEYKEVI